MQKAKQIIRYLLKSFNFYNRNETTDLEIFLKKA